MKRSNGQINETKNMALKFNKKWRRLAEEFKKNGRPFHYQYLIRKEEEEDKGGEEE